MVSKYESIPLSLPSEFVETSSGFGLDIGCSTAKLIYRSKDDYENGKPKKDELMSGTGRVYLVPSIARTELDDVMELIRSKCDLIHHGDEKTEVITTGAGCNLYKARLEEGLNISLNNQMEFECFIKAFQYMEKTTPRDELFYPEHKEAMEDGKRKAIKVSAFVEKLQDDMKFGFTLDPSKTDTGDASDKDPVFPCVIAMCGSGVGYMKVEADGQWQFVDGALIGGRAFLGLSALLTGEKDFAKIYSSITKGSCLSVDDFGEDLVTDDDSTTDDRYSAIKDFVDGDRDIKNSALAFGKAVTRDRSQIKDDDILFSLYRVVCLPLLQIGMYACYNAEVHNLYFCGNFINNEEARRMMTQDFYMKKSFMPPEKQLQLRFIKHGGHLGALGAFMKAKEIKEKAASAEAK